MKLSRYNVVKKEKENTYAFNTLHGVFAKIKTSLWEKMEAGNEAAIRAFLPAGFWVEDEADELDVYRYEYYRAVFNKETVSLVIAPTMNCNFACAYCYEKGYTLPGKMDAKVEDAIVRFLEERRDKKISIHWFGGEPLMGFDTILSISKQLTDRNIAFEAVMTTNGSLFTDAMIAQLDELCIKIVKITLGGVGKAHDERRVSKNGNPSFDAIIAAIEKIMQRTAVKINVMVTVDRTNTDVFHEVSGYLSRRFPDYMYNRIKMMVNSLFNMTDFEGSENCITEEERSQFVKNLLLEDNIAHLSQVIPKRHTICMYQWENSYTIDPSGALYNCFEQIGNPSFAVGNLLNSGIPVWQEAKAVFNDNPFDDAECRDCVLLPVCGSGCVMSKQRYRARFGNEKKDCFFFKNTFADRLPKLYELKIKKKNEGLTDFVQDC